MTYKHDPIHVRMIGRDYRHWNGQVFRMDGFQNGSAFLGTDYWLRCHDVGTDTMAFLEPNSVLKECVDVTTKERELTLSRAFDRR